MRIAYVSGAYRAKTFFGVFLNIWKARRVAKKLWGMGWSVICPHMNTAFFSVWAGHNAAPVDYVAGDVDMLNRMRPRYDAIVVLPSWENSVGTNTEIMASIDRDLYVFMWPQDKDCLEFLGKEADEQADLE